MMMVVVRHRRHCTGERMLMKADPVTLLVSWLPPTTGTVYISNFQLFFVPRVKSLYVRGDDDDDLLLGVGRRF